MPQNWQSFLRSEENKRELFTFLSKQAGKIERHDKQVVVTNDKDVLCYPSTYAKEKLSPCSHEEADTRIMVHITDAVDKGHNSIMIRTVDTDVVVLAVAAVHTLGIKELWVAFGTGKNHKIVPTHSYTSALGPARSRKPKLWFCGEYRKNIFTLDKFTYLRGLLEGTAKTAIEGFSLTASNYVGAIELLERRYAQFQPIP
ncbi:hypothetical protein QZH41_003267 [Actinostola sp. cb2023]|nr:hypothetical protein QZH41_003267 [Actinostola sp. cb2023]